MGFSGSTLNPLPIGEAWIDLKTGAPTSEFFWFLNQLLHGATSQDSVNIANLFESQSSEASNDPVVQGISRALAFSGGKSASAADHMAITALQGIAAFSTQASAVLQRVIALERAAAFRSVSVTVPPPQIIPCTQATFPTLNSSNAGSFIYVSDYAHWIYWNGTTPEFADDGSDYYAIGQRSTGSPGWHLVDGTAAVPFLKADGTLGSKNLLNVAAQKVYLAALNAADALNGPVAPTISGSTDETTIGFNPAAGAAAASAGTASINNPLTGTPTNVLVPPFSGGGGGGGGSLVTDPHDHTLTAVTVSTTGEPENFTSILWYRQ